MPASVPIQGLDHDEQDRRCAFTGQFNDRRRTFGNLPLSKARNISVHRTGVAPVTVATTGFFGVTYTGGPTSPIPSTETRQIDDPNLAFWQSLPRFDQCTPTSISTDRS
jgi:hypothetical protein